MLPADYVTVEDGSNCTYSSSWTKIGAVGVQNDLPVVNPVSSSGYFDAS